jgi:hypothetical protein
MRYFQRLHSRIATALREKNRSRVGVEFEDDLPYVHRIEINEKGLIIKYDKRYMFWIQAESVVNVPWSGIKRIEWWGGDISPTGGYHIICALPYKKELRLALNLMFCNRKKAMKIIVSHVHKNKIAKEILEQFGCN